MKKLHKSRIISKLVETKLLSTIALLMRNFITNFVRILGIFLIQPTGMIKFNRLIVGVGDVSKACKSNKTLKEKCDESGVIPSDDKEWMRLIKDYEENERFILDEIKRVAEKFQVTIIGSFGIKRMYQNYPICNPDIHKRINNLLQYADIVAMLNRPGYYSPTIAKNLPDLVVMYFLKNAYSQTNSLDFTCDSRICKMLIKHT